MPPKLAHLLRTVLVLVSLVAAMAPSSADEGVCVSVVARTATACEREMPCCEVAGVAVEAEAALQTSLGCRCEERVRPAAKFLVWVHRAAAHHSASPALLSGVVAFRTIKRTLGADCGAASEAEALFNEFDGWPARKRAPPLI